MEQNNTKSLYENDSELLKQLMDHIPYSVFFKDKESRFIKINRECAVKFGFDNPEEAVGKTDFDFFGKEHAQRAFEDEQQIIKTGKAVTDQLEKETPKKDSNETHWALTSKFPLTDQQGNIIGTFGITRDVTDRIKAELALKKSELKYRSIFENIQDVIYRTDREGIITEISPSIEKYSGYKKDQLIGSPVSNFYYYPEDREKLIKKLRKNGEVSDFEIRLKTIDDKLVYTSVNSYILRDEEGNITGVEGIMRDITDRKLADRKLKETYNFFDQILSNTSEGIYVCDTDLTYTFWNKSMEHITGLKADEVLGKSPDEIFPHIKKNELNNYYRAALEGESLKSDDYFYKVPQTGKSGWVHAYYVPLRDEDDKISGILVTIVDITLRKKAEQKLRESDETLNKLSEQIPGTIYQFQRFEDGRTRFLFVSSGFKNLYELDPDEVLDDANPAFDRVVNSDYNKLIQSINRSFQTLNDWVMEYRVELPKKGLRWLRGIARPEKHKDGSVIWHGFISDITEEKQKENELHRTLDIVSDQNKRLVNFAHIVSHNLRNHAGNFTMLLSLLENDPSDEERDELLGYMQTASDRLNETIKDLNEIVDQQAEPDKGVKQLKFKSVIGKIKEILSTEIISSKVTFKENIPADLSISYNPAYLESILLNLISNAIKYRHPERNPEVQIDAKETKNGIQFTISDNGQGIDLEKYGNQLFGMYKTFHKNDNSKGIGLYITKNQIESFGGSINVESEPGKGTTFHINLISANHSNSEKS